MPFSFLNPWFWLGALAVAAPLWLHLRRRQETHLVRFSALRFLDDLPSPRRAPWRLRRWLLFLLRALAVWLIVAGFAWPYVRSVNTVPVRESRVYILDNTLSFQADEGFARARDKLVQELVAAEPGMQVAVVELTSAPRVLVTFGEARPSAADKLRALQPSFERGSYLPAFRLANDLLEHSLGEHKRIVLLSDNQANQWTENVNTPPFLKGVEVDLPHVSAKVLPNLSLSEPQVQRIFLGDKSLVNLTLKLTHTGPARTARLLVRANGRTITDRAVDLEKQPATMMLQAQWEADPGAWVQGDATVAGAPDALAADNVAYFALRPVQEGRVALLADSPYLRLALSPDIMRGQWATRVLDPANLGPEIAAAHEDDVLCIESGYLQSAEARKLLHRYLEHGRGVLLILNRVTPAADACLRELGFQVEGPVRTSPDEPERFQFVFSNHPIFHPFLSPDFGNLMDIRIWQYVRLRAPQAMPLIFSGAGAPLFFQSTRTTGKLFVTAFGFDRDSTSWPIQQTFIPFLDLTLQAARAEDPTPTNFEPGALVMVHLPAGSTNRAVVLRSATRQLARVPVAHGRAELRLPHAPGCYVMSYDESARVEKTFVVNVPPKESELTYVAAPQVVKLWQVAHPTAQPTPAKGGELRLAGVLQQRLWWWMLVGGLFMLFLESGVAERQREGQ
jgi:hypothetical protein